MSLISCFIITSLSLASSDKKRVKQMVYKRVQQGNFTESIGSETVNHMSLITCLIITSLISCRSSLVSIHVTHLMSRSHVTDHMSLISCFITTSLISCLITTSLITCLIITSLILSYCLYTLGWQYLISGHDLCPLVTAYYYWGPLPTPSAVTYSHPAASFSQKNKTIRFQGVSHSSQSRSHVTHLMFHQNFTQLGLKP